MNLKIFFIISIHLRLSGSLDKKKRIKNNIIRLEFRSLVADVCVVDEEG